MIRDPAMAKNCVRRALFSVARSVYWLYWINRTATLWERLSVIKGEVDLLSGTP